MAVTIEQKIKQAEEALKLAQNEKNRAEAQVTVLKKELETQQNRAKELGVDPANLEEEISKIRSQIGGLFQQVRECIPDEYLAKVGL